VILDRLPLSLGFPLTSVCYVTVSAASVLIFREEIGLLRGLGIVLIVLGVVVIGSEEE
jgi:multidrug transporter EmrE-like cation transporter